MSKQTSKQQMWRMRDFLVFADLIAHKSPVERGCALSPGPHELLNERLISWLPVTLTG